MKLFARLLNACKAARPQGRKADWPSRVLALKAAFLLVVAARGGLPEKLYFHFMSSAEAYAYKLRKLIAIDAHAL